MRKRPRRPGTTCDSGAHRAAAWLLSHLAATKDRGGQERRLQRLGEMAGTNNRGDCGHEEMAVAATNGGGSKQGTRPWRGFRAEAATDRGRWTGRGGWVGEGVAGGSWRMTRIEKLYNYPCILTQNVTILHTTTLWYDPR
jgi:hypothetical protein